MSIESVNPTTGRRGPTFASLTKPELEDKLAGAARAFAAWSRTPVATRAGVVAQAGEIFAREAERLGRLATEEMGKLLVAGRQEAEKCATGCRYYAANAELFLRSEVVTEKPAAVHGGRGERGEVRFEPLGAVLAVMPWN